MKFSKLGYKKNSKDKNNPYNLINSNRITMADVLHPLLGVSDLGDMRIMYPGEEHEFRGSKVLEVPMKGFNKLRGGMKKYQPGGQWDNNSEINYNFPKVPIIIPKKQQTITQTTIGPERYKSYYDLKQEEIKRQKYYKEQGYDEKGNPKLLTKIAENKTLNKFINNVSVPIEAAMYLEGAGEVYQLAKPLLKQAGKYLTEKTILKDAYKLNPLANKEAPLNVLYHNSNSPSLVFEDVDLLRTGKSQLKKRHSNLPELDKPSGFYTTDNPNSVFMGGSQTYAMDIPANSKVYDMKSLGRTTDRISKSELLDLQKQGYDVIKGRNMIGLDEFIPLNKSKLLNFRNLGERVKDGSQTFEKGFYKTETPNWLKGYKPIKKIGGIQKFQPGGGLFTPENIIETTNQGASEGLYNPQNLYKKPAPSPVEFDFNQFDYSYIPLLADTALNSIATTIDNKRKENYRNSNLANPFNYLPQNNAVGEQRYGISSYQEGGEFDNSQYDAEEEQYLWDEEDPVQQVQQDEQEQVESPEEKVVEEQPIINDMQFDFEQPDTDEFGQTLIDVPSVGRVATPIPPTVYDGGDREIEALNFLTNKGLAPHVAAGIVGNLIQESSLNPNAVGDGGKAYGIAQWYPDRRTNLQDNSFAGQLEFLFNEASQRGDIEKINKSTTPEEAAFLFAKHFERPKNIEQSRMSNASRVYQKYINSK